MRELLTMFLSFFKIGALTIGGGYAMLPVMEDEFVTRKQWVTHSEICDIFSIAQSLPGVIAINTSMYIGYKVKGIKGAFTAAFGVILPSFIIIAVIFTFLPAISVNPYVQKAFAGVRAGVAAMILASAIRLGKSVIKNVISVAVALAAFILIAFLNVNAIFVILTCILIGVLIPLFKKKEAKIG